MRAPEIVILGDINLDWSATGLLPFPFTGLRENGVIVWMPIAELPGGSGLNFAAFSQQAGYQPLLLGRVGDDIAGRFLVSWLAEKGIASAVSVDPSARTGKAMIVRDGSDIRLLVNNSENANALLSQMDVEAHREALTHCTVLYISGYCLQDRAADRFGATLRAMELASQAEVPEPPVIVFDVVPHRIYDMYSFEEFKGFTEKVDILVSEVATMRRFLDLGSRDERIDQRIAMGTVELLKPHYRRFILRYGPSGCDEQILWDGNSGDLRHEETYHREAKDKRGFGDLLVIRALRDFFAVLPQREPAGLPLKT
jgi:sugar/nucleoside kinase (ribokinase family)